MYQYIVQLYMQICETKHYKILPNCEITPKTGVGIGLLNPRSCNQIFSIIGSRCNSPMGAGDNGSDARVSFSESCVCGFDPYLGQDFFTCLCPLQHMWSEWNYPISVCRREGNSNAAQPAALRLSHCLFTFATQLLHSSVNDAQPCVRLRTLDTK